MKRAALLLLLFSASLLMPARAQKVKEGQQVPEENKLSKVPLTYSAPLRNKSSFNAERVDLSGIMPPVGYQGPQYSCSAWAVGYACRSYYNANGNAGAFKTVKPDSSENIISPAFIYNSLNHKKYNAQIKISTALELMKDKGACSYKSMPYSVGCDVKPTKEQEKEAENFKIETFGRLDTARATMVEEIKGYLRNKQPVVIASIYGGKYFEAGKTARDTGDYVWRNLATEKGGHAVVIVGFDDRIKALKIMNSFGSDWGNKGFGWISYDIAPKVISAAFIIKPAKKIKPVSVTGNAARPKEETALLENAAPKEDAPKQEKETNEDTPADEAVGQSPELQLNTTKEKAAAQDDPNLSWWDKQVIKFNNWREEKAEEKSKRKNKFDVKLVPVVQTDSTRFAMDVQVEVTGCMCDSFQVAVPLFWGDVQDRNKKAMPVQSYYADYSLANNQGAIILAKQAFTGKFKSTYRVSIPLDKIAIPKGTKGNGRYIKALSRLIAQPVWYNDDFGVKTFAQTPVDIYY